LRAARAGLWCRWPLGRAAFADKPRYRTPDYSSLDMTVVRVYPIRGGEIRLSPAFSVKPSGAGVVGQLHGWARQLLRVGAAWQPVPTFAIEHPDEGLLLVDTGYDPSVANDPANTMGPSSPFIFDHRAEPVAPQLEALGLGQPRIVVMTHCHMDHLSGLRQFADAELLLDEAEFAIATRPGSSVKPGGYHPVLLREHRRIRTVAPKERWGVFDETLDLFGDGSIRLLRTPGHTFGHLSLLLETEHGPVLLCGDAAHVERQLHEVLEMTVMQDRRGFRDSLGRIQRYLTNNPNTIAIPGHDAVAWAALPNAF
jgi:N-acyl homoserine lactone hydrolase